MRGRSSTGRGGRWLLWYRIVMAVSGHHPTVPLEGPFRYLGFLALSSIHLNRVNFVVKEISTAIIQLLRQPHTR
jgi:hypothetical protein